MPTENGAPASPPDGGKLTPYLASIAVSARHPAGPTVTMTFPPGAISWKELDLICNSFLARNYHGLTPMTYDLTPEGLPICPKHNVVMSRREKQGDVWYSHNAGSEDNEVYCRGYKGKQSPGYDLD